MKKKTEGYSEKLLELAEEEFLQKGFMDASLRDIAANCNVSTSMIYTRFRDKAGLFDALVTPVLNELMSWYDGSQEDFHALASEEQILSLVQYTNEKMVEMVDFIYDHLNTFKLLTMNSEGTVHSTFLHDLVEKHVDYTMKYIDAIGSDVIESGRITRELLHILATAVYTGIFETVIHNMSRDEAKAHVRKLVRFFMSGWNDLMKSEAT